MATNSFNLEVVSYLPMEKVVINKGKKESIISHH